MQAITTKFLAPTNCRGARVKATCQARTLTVDWDHSKDVDGNHDAAARALILSLGWVPANGKYGAWSRGALPLADGGNVYVCVTSDSLIPLE